MTRHGWCGLRDLAMPSDSTGWPITPETDLPGVLFSLVNAVTYEKLLGTSNSAACPEKIEKPPTGAGNIRKITPTVEPQNQNGGSMPHPRLNTSRQKLRRGPITRRPPEHGHPPGIHTSCVIRRRMGALLSVHSGRGQSAGRGQSETPVHPHPQRAPFPARDRDRSAEP